MICFQPESQVASCKTLAGALKLCGFLQQWFTDDPADGPPLKFRAIIETSGKITVHSSYPVYEEGMAAFKVATEAFKAAYFAAAAA